MIKIKLLAAFLIFASCAQPKALVVYKFIGGIGTKTTIVKGKVIKVDTIYNHISEKLNP